MTARLNATWRIALTLFDFLSLQRVLNIFGGSLLVLSLLYNVSSELGAKLPPWEPFGVFGAAFMLITPVFGAGAALRTFTSRNPMRLLPNGRALVLCGVTLAVTLMAVIATLPVLFAHLGESAGNPISQANPLKVFAMAWTCAAMISIVSFIATASTQSMLLTILLPILLSQLVFALSHPASDLGDATTANSMLVVLVFTFSATAWLAFCAWFLRTPSIRPTVNVMPGAQRINNLLDKSVGKTSADHTPVTRVAAIRYFLLGTQSLQHSWYWRAPMVLLTMLVLWLVLVLWRGVGTGDPHVILLSMGIAAYVASLVSITSAYMPVQRARRLWLRAGISREELFRTTERVGLTGTLLFVGTVSTGLAVWSLARRPDLVGHILLAVPIQLALALCLFYACLGYTGNWNRFAALLDIAVGIWLLVVILLPPSPDYFPLNPLTILTITAVLSWLLRMRARRRWRTVHWRPVPEFKRQIT